MKLKVTYLKRYSNLSQLIKFLKFIKGNEILKQIKPDFEGVTNTGYLLKVSQLSIKVNVLDVYDPEHYIRTGNLLKSLMVEPTRKKIEPGIAFFSDPDIATAEAGISDGVYSYLAFFEHPEAGGFDSFIRSVKEPGEFSRVRYRPFFEELTNTLQRESTEIAHVMTNRHIKKRLPQSGKNDVD